MDPETEAVIVLIFFPDLAKIVCFSRKLVKKLTSLVAGMIKRISWTLTVIT